jgi:MFS family permease
VILDPGPELKGSTGSPSIGVPPAGWRASLLVTLLMQVALSFLVQAMVVLGPNLTDVAGVRPELVGHVASFVSFGTLWFLMGGLGLLNALGPVQLLQYGVLLGSGGLMLSLTGSWIPVLLAGLAVGFGYGPAPPAGNEILARTAPQQHRSLIFSIKQSGAPLGYALAGLLLPPIGTVFGWRTALVVAALLATACAFAVEPFRAGIDQRRAALRFTRFRGLLSPGMVLTPFRALGRSLMLVRLAYAGAAMSVVQGSAFALFVTFLNVELGFPLTSAGAAFAVMQVAGAAARIGCGWIADRMASPTLLVAALAIGSAAVMVVAAGMTAGWPWPAILAASAAIGTLSASWNGILMAEIAQHSRPDRIGESTSAATFFIFIGYVVGPALATSVIRLSGSYATAFLIVACFPISAAVVLLAGSTRSAAS